MVKSKLVFRVDFTSAPRKKKPITCAVCQLNGVQLVVESILEWVSTDEFEVFLANPEPWTAALDFPFGQPLRLIEAMGWPLNWSGYVKVISGMAKDEFVEMVKHYSANQPKGDKHHFRITDKHTGACSPMMLFGVPVGRMFYEGAIRLWDTNLNVLPCRPSNASRTVVEGYPALVARNLVGGLKYKVDTKGSADKSKERSILIHQIQSNTLAQNYGVNVSIDPQVEQSLLVDQQGDRIDAVLCAIQAASFSLPAFRHKCLPVNVNPIEGWIADPTYHH